MNVWTCSLLVQDSLSLWLVCHPTRCFFFFFFWCSLSYLSLYSQSQAVSDGGKHEQPTCTLTVPYISHFYKLKHVCARQKQISDSVSFLVMIFCADKWVCVCRVEHVCAGLWREQLQPSRDSSRRGRRCQQRDELGRLIWETVGGPLWSQPLHGETRSTHEIRNSSSVDVF